jgi:hypothetical protein
MDAEGVSLSRDSWKRRQPFNMAKLEEALANLPLGWEVDILIQPNPKSRKLKYITLKRV